MFGQGNDEREEPEVINIIAAENAGALSTYSKLIAVWIKLQQLNCPASSKRRERKMKDLQQWIQMKCKYKNS